jgi:hypothetical protein
MVGRCSVAAEKVGLTVRPTTYLDEPLNAPTQNDEVYIGEDRNLDLISFSAFLVENSLKLEYVAVCREGTKRNSNGSSS